MTESDARERAYFSLRSHAAKIDFAWEQHLLGMCYHDGRGTPIDKILAYKWFIISASNPIWDHPTRKKAYKDEGAALMKNATPDELAEAQKLADEWIQKNRRMKL